MLYLEYVLKNTEIEEALLSLNWRKEGKYKKINIFIMTMIGVIFLVLYNKTPERVYLLFIVFFIVLILFYILYVPSFLRKRKARKMAYGSGIYKIKISNKGIFSYHDSCLKSFSEGKWLFFESEYIYTLKNIDSIFCIPKRIFGKNEESEFLFILHKNNINKIKLITKKGDV